MDERLLNGGVVEVEEKINVHLSVTREESKKIQEAAEKAGLSKAQYIRSKALEEDIYEAPTRELMSAFFLVRELEKGILASGNERLIEKIGKVREALLKAYYMSIGESNDNEIEEAGLNYKYLN